MIRFRIYNRLREALTPCPRGSVRFHMQMILMIMQYRGGK